MRTARSLLAGAALTGCLVIAAPAAHATGAVDAYDPSGSKTTSTTDSSGWAAEHGGDNGGWQKSDEGGDPGWDGQRPHGGMHTGGGGMSLATGGGLAAGGVLLLGGLGAGAYFLRRRTASAPTLA